MRTAATNNSNHHQRAVCVCVCVCVCAHTFNVHSSPRRKQCARTAATAAAANANHRNAAIQCPRLLFDSLRKIEIKFCTIHFRYCAWLCVCTCVCVTV